MTLAASVITECDRECDYFSGMSLCTFQLRSVVPLLRVVSIGASRSAKNPPHTVFISPQSRPVWSPSLRQGALLRSTGLERYDSHSSTDTDKVQEDQRCQQLPLILWRHLVGSMAQVMPPWLSSPQ